MSHTNRPNFAPRRALTLFLAAVILGLAAGGYRLYRVEAQHIRDAKYREIAAIGELKVGQIVEWRRTRLNNIKNAVGGAYFERAIEISIEDPNDAGVQDAIIERLRLEQSTEDCSDVLLLDLGGRIMLSAGDDSGAVGIATMKAVAEALAGKQAVLSDLFRSPEGGTYIDAVAPVSDADNRPIALMVLRSDATTFLYPFIQSWPIPSRSAETLLIQKEGSDVLYLNELRHRTGAALKLRIPLTQREHAAVQAVTGKLGLYEGKDYRGVEVLADLRPVPGSPWFMVAKVDASEILAELHYRGGVIIFFVLLFILLAVVAVAYFYRRREARLYRSLHSSEMEKQQAQEALRVKDWAIESAATPIAITDLAGNLSYANPAFVKLWGYGSQEEMLGKPVGELGRMEENVTEVFDALRARGNWSGEHIARTKDGTFFDIQLTASLVADTAGRPVCMLASVADITHRKRVERELTESKALVDAVVENVPLMIFLKEATDLRFVIFNRAGEELLGYDRTALLGKNNLDLFPPEQAANFMAKDREVLDGEAGMLDIPEEPILTAGKGTRLLHTRKVCILGADGTTKYLLGISEDITERKQVEEALRRQAEELSVRNDTLTRFNRVAVGRELRMVDLKREVNELCGKLGEPPRHRIAVDETSPPVSTEART
jgi:PAS domain S-box-containing protein